MSCLNCNKETSGTDVFCEECKQAMEAFPIPKGTPVAIPIYTPPAAQKKQTTHRFASAEDQLAAAQRIIRRLKFYFVFVSFLLILVIAALVYVCYFGIPHFF